MKIEYPHILVSSWSPIDFASVALECAQSDVKNAAADGRAHSLPEALEIAEKSLGKALVVNPTHVRWSFLFGDEATGRSATQAREKAARDQAILVASILGIVAGLWGLTSFFNSFATALIFIVGLGILGILLGYFGSVIDGSRGRIHQVTALIVCILVGAAVPRIFSLSLEPITKGERAASFYINNYTPWSDHVLVWFSNDGKAELCPIIRNVARFTRTSVVTGCKYLLGKEYKIYATWASSKSSLLSTAKYEWPRD